MKLIDLLNKIANGEIKEGTKIKKGLVFKNGTLYWEDTIVTFTGITQKGLNVEVEIIEEKQQQGRWEPKEEGTAYFSINDWGVIFQTHYKNSPQDWFRILNKNVFKTDSEARKYLEYKTALLEAEKPFVEGKENYFIRLEEGNIKLAFTYSRYAGIIFLGQDKDVAQAFLDKWEKQILKYEFGIEE